MYSGIAKILLSFTPGLIKKTCATYLTDEMQNKANRVSVIGVLPR